MDERPCIIHRRHRDISQVFKTKKILCLPADCHKNADINSFESLVVPVHAAGGDAVSSSTAPMRFWGSEHARLQPTEH
jgi:hypothetical protein